MNTKNLTIGGALVLLIVTLIGRLNGVVSDDMLIWAAMIVAMAGVSYALAVGATDWYKRMKFTQTQIDCINDWHALGCDQEKRLTHDFAVRAGFISMACCGVVFVLIEGADWRIALVISVFWGITSAVIGFTTPLVYRLFRKRFIRAAEELENEKEAEALNRPSEVPRDE